MDDFCCNEIATVRHRKHQCVYENKKKVKAQLSIHYAWKQHHFQVYACCFGHNPSKSMQGQDKFECAHIFWSKRKSNLCEVRIPCSRHWQENKCCRWKMEDLWVITFQLIFKATYSSYKEKHNEYIICVLNPVRGKI